MVFPPEAPLPAISPGLVVEPLTCAAAGDMVALNALAYPGYFRPATCRMGRYFGIRDAHGRLIAMGGERLCLQRPGQPSWREISDVCVHPDHTCKGLGTAILHHVLAAQRTTGDSSWLWVAATNHRAHSLYERLGFLAVNRTELHRMRRLPD